MQYNNRMHIYFSGIGGTGIGPLAEIAHDAGYAISGSDLQDSPMTKKLRERGVSVQIGQTRETIGHVHGTQPIDWFVYTAGLPKDHPELAYAHEQGIRVSKRDELLSQILKDKNLKLIAAAGTHGKTTTTGIFAWLFKQLGVPVSYLVGSTMSFGPSGKYDAASEYFVYECDEFDRNLLNFFPDHAVITSLDYDHPDIYPTLESYNNAFRQFIDQSKKVVMWQHDAARLGDLPEKVTQFDETTTPVANVPLVGHNRHNGWLASAVMSDITGESMEMIAEKLHDFPGTHRRFEKLADNLYSDYGHHPAEVTSTLRMARELSDHVVLVYQPHQNIRQHEMRDQYTDCMEQAEMIYWLPTYLSREDPNLEVLTPEQLSAKLTNRESVVMSDFNDELWQHIEAERRAGSLVLCMGAGSIDAWVRQQLK